MPSLEQLEKATALTRSGKGRWRLSFPGGVSVDGGSRTIRLARKPAAERQPLPETFLAVPGAAEVDGWAIRATCEAAPHLADADPAQLWVSPDAILGKLVIRSRRNGDRMQPQGLGGSKKVQDILVDRKVPVEDRDSVPIVSDDEGILWVIGHARDERAAVPAPGEKAVHLLAEPLKAALEADTIETRARSSKAQQGRRRKAP
jgi:tRNA(Ile)-lysidine synthase